jgi:cytochrome c
MAQHKHALVTQDKDSVTCKSITPKSGSSYTRSQELLGLAPPDPFNPQGTDMKKFVLALAMTAAAAAPAFADLALATSKNCMACHAVDKKLVGPSYKDVAAKYKADKSAVDKLATKIVKGGSGVWGAVPMPANPQVNEAEAKKLAAWVLSAK